MSLAWPAASLIVSSKTCTRTAGQVGSATDVAHVKRYCFELHITPEEYLEYYRGVAQHVLARATTGEIVQFPAACLQRFVTPEGIHGCFELTCTDTGKLVELKRLEAA